MRYNIEEIVKGLESDDRHVRKASILACTGNNQDDAKMRKNWFESSDANKIAAAIVNSPHCGCFEGLDTVLEAINHDYDYGFAEKLLLKTYKKSSSLIFDEYPPELYCRFYSAELIRTAVYDSIVVSSSRNKKMIESNEWYLKLYALYEATKAPGVLDFCQIAEILTSFGMPNEVNEVAAEAIRALKVPLPALQKLYDRANSIHERILIMRATKGRIDGSLVFDPNNLSDDEIRECAGLHFSDKVIEKWRKGTEKEKAVAMNVLKTRPTLPSVIVRSGLLSQNLLVREAAAEYYFRYGDEEKPYRTFFPADKVYKKCVGNVIVEGHIPKKATVRESACGGGRASAFITKKVHGTSFGQNIGIAFYNCKTVYRPNNIIYCTGFDASFNEHGNGFHFFNSFEEARKYYY